MRDSVKMSRNIVDINNRARVCNTRKQRGDDLSFFFFDSAREKKIVVERALSCQDVTQIEPKVDPNDQPSEKRSKIARNKRAIVSGSCVVIIDEITCCPVTYTRCQRKCLM